MAKFSKSLSFKGISIDYEKDLITEITKDDTKYYKLSEILNDWAGIEGISLTLKKEDELDSNFDGEEDE